MRTQLEWVQSNRTEQRRDVLLGTLSAELVERKARRAKPDETARIAAAMASFPDEAFRSQCRVADVRGNVLVLEVSDARLLGFFRMRWAEPLKTYIAESVGGLNIRNVRFESAVGAPWRTLATAETPSSPSTMDQS